MKGLIVIGIVAGVIIVSAVLQLFEVNPYWNYFPFIVLGFSSYLLVRIIIYHNQVSKEYKAFLNSISTKC